MEEVVQIRCKNNKKTQNFPKGSTLSEIFKGLGLEMRYGPVNAKVNNQVVDLVFTVYRNKDV